MTGATGDGEGLPALAVTGSTGALGQQVARALAEAGVAQRLLARCPGRAPVLPGAVPVPVDYGDRALALQALEDVTTLLMVSASEAPDRVAQHLTFVDAAAEAGVRHVVYTSFLGASADSVFTLGRDHWATEQRIRDSGMGFTFLRDSLYLDFLADLPGDDGVIRGPAGQGRVAAVARSDVARCATAVLLAPEAHAGATYDLTGPEALTLDEVAQALSAHTGRRVTFHDETVAEAYASRRRWPAPAWQYDAWVSTYTAIAAGELEQVSDHVRTLTGRDPLTLRQLLAEQDR
ncbi:SDR family oxidoreductase [Nocardioides sp. SYSU DS0651]|uniref:SDR family oxidoreductase n=1 Tax=Nocardioides sp. SYSU DS0651 TaxID=3415955 RepID=UPI003F4B3562